MDFTSTKRMIVLSRKFINDKLIKGGLDILKVGHVPASPNDGVLTDSMKTLHILNLASDPYEAKTR
jgi:hypothetical protein